MLDKETNALLFRIKDDIAMCRIKQNLGCYEQAGGKVKIYFGHNVTFSTDIGKNQVRHIIQHREAS